MKPELKQRGGQVAATALEHGPEGVGAAAQSSRDGIGVVHAHQQLVGVLHAGEKPLGHAGLPFPEPVEQMPAQLRRRLGQTVEPRRRLDLEIPVAGKGRPVDQRRGQDRLGIFLLGVVEEAGVGHPRKRTDGLLGLPQRRLGLGEVGADLLRPPPMHGPDGATGVADHPPARSQAGFASRVGGAQLAGGRGDTFSQFGPAQDRRAAQGDSALRSETHAGCGHLVESRTAQLAARRRLISP